MDFVRAPSGSGQITEPRCSPHVPRAFCAAVPLTLGKKARSSSSRHGTPQNRYERNIKGKRKSSPLGSPFVLMQALRSALSAGCTHFATLLRTRPPQSDPGGNPKADRGVPRLLPPLTASGPRRDAEGGRASLPRRLADKEQSAAAGRGAPTPGHVPAPGRGRPKRRLPRASRGQRRAESLGARPPLFAPSPRRPRAGRREGKGRGRPQGDTRRRRPASRAPLTWHLQTMSASCASRSTTLPLPSSPHWAPSTTVTLLPGRRAAHPPLGMAGAGAPCSAMARAARSGAAPGTCGSARRPRCPRLLPAGRGCRIQVVVPPTGTARPAEPPPAATRPAAATGALGAFFALAPISRAPRRGLRYPSRPAVPARRPAARSRARCTLGRVVPANGTCN